MIRRALSNSDRSKQYRKELSSRYFEQDLLFRVATSHGKERATDQRSDARPVATSGGDGGSGRTAMHAEEHQTGECGLFGFPSCTARKGKVRERLAELKMLHEDGLVPTSVYEDEVRHRLKELR